MLLSLALMELSKHLGTGCVTSGILLSFSWTIFYLPFIHSYLPPLHPPVVLLSCSFEHSGSELEDVDHPFFCMVSLL